MANDFYINEEDDQEQWDLLEEDFHEWDTMNHVVAMVKTKGLQSVLSTILSMLDNQ